MVQALDEVVRLDKCDEQLQARELFEPDES